MRLGGLKVRKPRRNFADPLERGDVFMYHDASSAVLLDLRRRHKSCWRCASCCDSGWGYFGSVS